MLGKDGVGKLGKLVEFSMCVKFILGFRVNRVIIDSDSFFLKL